MENLATKLMVTIPLIMEHRLQTHRRQNRMQQRVKMAQKLLKMMQIKKQSLSLQRTKIRQNWIMDKTKAKSKVMRREIVSNSQLLMMVRKIQEMKKTRSRNQMKNSRKMILENKSRARNRSKMWTQKKNLRIMIKI